MRNGDEITDTFYIPCPHRLRKHQRVLSPISRFGGRPQCLVSDPIARTFISQHWPPAAGAEQRVSEPSAHIGSRTRDHQNSIATRKRRIQRNHLVADDLHRSAHTAAKHTIYKLPYRRNAGPAKSDTAPLHVSQIDACFGAKLFYQRSKTRLGGTTGVGVAFSNAQGLDTLTFHAGQLPAILADSHAGTGPAGIHSQIKRHSQ